MIYLDAAATSLVKPLSVGREMLRAMQSCASPGRGGHEPAMRAAETVYRCRETAARLFHVPDPERVVMTMNATHALNLAIRSLAARGTRVLISGYEHNSVTRPLQLLGAEVMTASSPLFDRDAALEAFRERIADAELVVCTLCSTRPRRLKPSGSASMTRSSWSAPTSPTSSASSCPCMRSPRSAGNGACR